MQEKYWVVTLTQGLEVTHADIFDNEKDAENYAREMVASKQGNYQVLSAVMNRRSELVGEEQRWAELTDFNSDCIECLVEDLSGCAPIEFNADACAKFLAEHKNDLQKHANEIVYEYIRREIREFIDNDRVILG